MKNKNLRLDNMFYWCELAKQPPSVSYPWLFQAHKFGLNACMLSYEADTALDFGSKLIKASGNNTKPLLPQEYNRVISNCIQFAFILRDNIALQFYSGIQLHPHENELYKHHLNNFTKYPWIDLFKPDQSPLYEHRHDLVWGNLFITLAGGNDKALLKQIEFVELFEGREQKKQLQVEQDKKDGIRKIREEYFQEDPTTPYSTGFPALQWERELYEQLYNPFLQVLKSCLKGDEIAFNEQLIAALQQHKNFYENFLFEGEEIRSRQNGWVSMLLTMATTIAYNRGMKVAVTSDYIPGWLYKGAFDGLSF